MVPQLQRPADGPARPGRRHRAGGARLERTLLAPGLRRVDPDRQLRRTARRIGRRQRAGADARRRRPRRAPSPTRSTTGSTARTCSSSRSNWIRARARSPRPGTLMYKDSHGAAWKPCSATAAPRQGGGFMDKLVGAGKRLVTGESLFTTVFSHAGASGKARVAFAAPYPGTIVPMTLSNYGGRIICQKDSFLCAARGVSDRHVLPEEDHDRAVRRRGLHHAEARGRRPGVRARGRHHRRARTAPPASASTSTPAAWSR